jgi:hypothetical protein
MQKVGGDGECMGWSGVWVEVVDGVGSSTLAGFTYMGEGGCVASTGMRAGAGMGAGAVAGARGIGGGWERKIKGPGS